LPMTATWQSMTKQKSIFKTLTPFTSLKRLYTLAIAAHAQDSCTSLFTQSSSMNLRTHSS
jgi:hypothetical protein